MRARPERGNVVDKPEIRDVGPPGPGFDLLAWNRRRICRIWQAGDEQADIAAAPAEARVSGNEAANSLRFHEASDECHRDRAAGFRRRLQSVGVDAGSGNQRDTLAVDA